MDEQPHAKDPAALRTLGLTRREAEILAWIERGRSNAQVATQLEIKERTVAKHLEHVFQILGVHNRTAAAKAHKLLHDHL